MDEYDMGIMFEHGVEDIIREAVWNALQFDAGAMTYSKQALTDEGIEWDNRYAKYVIKHIDSFYHIPQRGGVI